MDYEKCDAARKKATQQLLSIPGVHSVGIGSKEVAGRRTRQPAIKVYLESKKPLSEIPSAERIPKEIDGVPTDIIQAPQPTSLGIPAADLSRIDLDMDKHRPLSGGIQVTRVGRGDGTLGCFCRVPGDENTIIGLTNHHVLYALNEQAGGEQVGQPTSEESCTGCCSDFIGTVRDSQIDEDVDLALIQLDKRQEWLAEVMEIGPVRGSHQITAEEASGSDYQVKKRGRTTGLTGGVVSAVNASGSINLRDGGTRAYSGVIRIDPNPDEDRPEVETAFAVGGDSGSALLNNSDEVVGIIFGRSGNGGLADSISAVLDKFSSGVAAERRIQLEIATADESGDIQRVPAFAMTALDSREAAAIERPAARTAPVAHLEHEIRGSAMGDWYADLYLRHMSEVNGLIQGNRRVAAVWHRSGGAALFQSLVRALRDPGLCLPRRINGRPLGACVESVGRILNVHGSPSLQRDLAALLPTVPDIGGLSYSEILETLRQSGQKVRPA